MARKRTFDWDGIEYGSAEYHRRWRLANNEHSREWHRKYDSEMYKKHPKREQARRQRYRDKYPNRIKANQAVRRALESGKIIKLLCNICNDENTVAHHDDWNKPLDVIWLCEIHHKARHKELKDKVSG